MVKIHLAPVNLALINDTGRWDLHPFLPPALPADFIASIERVGVLHPPLLQELDSGDYDILAGRRRIEALKKIGKVQEQNCFVVARTAEPSSIFQLLLESHCLTAPLSPMELAYFFRIGLQYMSPARLTELFPPAMRYTPQTFNRYLQLLALEQEIQVLVHSQFISERIAYDLLRMPGDDRVTLVRLFCALQLGGGKQNRLMSLLRDVCSRDNTSISSLVSAREIASILDHEKMNPPQKIQNLSAVLQRMTAPTYEADKEQFRAQISKIRLPPCCEVHHAPAFESDAITLSIHFQNLDHFMRIWPELATALPRGTTPARSAREIEENKNSENASGTQPSGLNGSETRT